ATPPGVCASERAMAHTHRRHVQGSAHLVDALVLRADVAARHHLLHLRGARHRAVVVVYLRADRAPRLDAGSGPDRLGRSHPFQRYAGDAVVARRSAAVRARYRAFVRPAASGAWRW